MRIRDIGKELSLDAAYEIDPEKKYILAFKNPLDMNLQHFMVKELQEVRHHECLRDERRWRCKPVEDRGIGE